MKLETRIKLATDALENLMEHSLTEYSSEDVALAVVKAFAPELFADPPGGIWKPRPAADDTPKDHTT